MSRKGRELTGEEKKLWRRVASGLKTRRPLPAAPEEDEEPKRAPVRVSTAKSTPTPKRTAPSPAPPANRGAEKNVRRGKVEIGASIDLHGHTQDSALAALKRFLAAAHRRGDRTVIVITGAGRSGEGVLKKRLPDWLAHPEIKPLTAGYAQAHRTHGGSGAFYVFLKRPRED